MHNKRFADPARVEAMYAVYLAGDSLAAVGEAFGVSRQSVYELFATRKLALRTKSLLPFVIFNGEKFTKGNHGYYRSTVGGHGRLLHRVIWEFHKGPIPAGWDVHHDDENPEHNDISNFKCLPKADHTRLHHRRKVGAAC